MPETIDSIRKLAELEPAVTPVTADECPVCARRLVDGFCHHCGYRHETDEEES